MITVFRRHAHAETLFFSRPKYRNHKATGQAIVTLNGRDHYLCAHGMVASKREYDRLSSEWLANGCNVVVANADQGITIVELPAMYVRFPKAYYNESSEWTNTALSLRPLKNLHGELRVAEFSPLKLKSVRQKMIESELCRNEINKRIGRINRMFKWGEENEVVEPSDFHGLQDFFGRKGSPGARCLVQDSNVRRIANHELNSGRALDRHGLLTA